MQNDLQINAWSGRCAFSHKTILWVKNAVSVKDRRRINSEKSGAECEMKRCIINELRGSQVGLGCN